MERDCVRLEALKLAMMIEKGYKPEAMIETAKKFEKYILPFTRKKKT